MSQQLRDWLGQTNNDERQALADRAGTSVAHLWQLAGGHRKASLELAKRLEDASKGALTIEGLRPDIFASRSIKAA
ncbi:YdaS family helix-turn-helix protein [Halomonas sp. SSL-5]|uniref:YdaS family helix-turn-helix protein n=1 Tax=Halomonas sp. SSL-5 TaxID=3065855 RepID=UPI00273A16AA|nr:YdaS family helix-turn-helix protein [Halomonas sp. SSL-5]MDY7116571.1 YdaS family helix-turn-helix protein [Halomonas sp. SSL-5]